MDKKEKLEWIYKGANSSVDREEYLLGRKVDKQLEQSTSKNHVDHECIPPSIKDYNKVVQVDQIDISAKLQEDPLVAIKKHEEEVRRQFLQNPVQLKRLQEAQEARLNAQKQKKKKKNSKLKLKPLKGKKHDKQSLDIILMHKFNIFKEKLTEDDLNNIMNENFSSDSGDEKEKSRPGKKEKRKKRTKNSSESSDTSNSKVQNLLSKNHRTAHSRTDEISRFNTKYKKFNNKKGSQDNIKTDSESEGYKKEHKFKEKRSRSRERKYKEDKCKKNIAKDSDEELNEIIMHKLKSLREDAEKSSVHVDCDSDLPNSSFFNNGDCPGYESDSDHQTSKKTKKFGLVLLKETSSNDSCKVKNNKEKNKTEKQIEPKQKRSFKSANKLSDKEKEKMRKEMLANATVRDKEREANVKRYKEQDYREEENTKIKYDKELVHNELVKLTRVSTVEERIKSNINNIQRSSSHMSSHFSKR